MNKIIGDAHYWYHLLFFYTFLYYPLEGIDEFYLSLLLRCSSYKLKRTAKIGTAKRHPTTPKNPPPTITANKIHRPSKPVESPTINGQMKFPSIC